MATCPCVEATATKITHFNEQVERKQKNEEKKSLKKCSLKLFNIHELCMKMSATHMMNFMIIHCMLVLVPILLNSKSDLCMEYND